MDRSQQEVILSDLKKKMVFITGPRQVGKTWLAKRIAESYSKYSYLNYDFFEDREIIHQAKWTDDIQLLVLDELHKMKDWKNFIKGVYDTKADHLHILVTGSARLEAFHHIGDSLAGRFFRHRLLPLTPAETDAFPLKHFLERGGFPEPCLAENLIDVDRWRNQYIEGVIRTDVLDFERIHDLRAMHLILEMLRRRVGSPVSYKSISEDVQLSPATTKKYIDILESLYIIFRVTPHSKNIARSLLKEPKIYFYDNGMVLGDEGACFENLVAVSLLKYTYQQVDSYGRSYDLKYLRTKDGKEIDFCLVQDETPQQYIEVKYSDSKISPALRYFHERYKVPSAQLVFNLRNEYQDSQITVRRAEPFLRSLS